jgi:hypothetical protein
MIESLLVVRARHSYAFSRHAQSSGAGRSGIGGWLVACACVASRARAADVPITEEARMHFAAGVVLLQDPKAPRYEEAYREFKAAYAAASSYKILGNLGLCAMKIERDAEAINAYETYLKEAGPELTAQEREQIRRDLLTLKAGIVQVTVSSNPPGATFVDVRTPIEGTDVRNTYGPVLTPLTLALRRGHHVMTARMAGYQDQRWEFDASGTTLPARVFVMVKPTPNDHAYPVREHPTPVAAYVAGAVDRCPRRARHRFRGDGAAEHNDFNSLNDGTHVAEATSAKTNGQTLNLITDCLLGGALVGAVVTTYMLLSRGSVERLERPALLPRLTPTWDARSGGIAAAWRF